MKRLEHAFTIVELLVVIVVIAALAALSIGSYNGTQLRARDAKMIDAADKVKDAVQLFASAQGHFPAGGAGSGTAIGSTTECATGAGGWFGSGNATCTVEDTLVASRYLSAGFSNQAKYNPDYAATNKTMTLYQVDATARTAILFYSMERPSSADTSHKAAEVSRCAYTMTAIDIALENAICFNY